MTILLVIIIIVATIIMGSRWACSNMDTPIFKWLKLLLDPDVFAKVTTEL